MACSHYKYAQRGRNCTPITIAYTSNEKFLPPLDPLYYQRYTTMLQYPGQTHDFITTVGDDAHPAEIKTYFGKTFGSQSPHLPITDPMEDSCPNCKTLQSNPQNHV